MFFDKEDDDHEFMSPGASSKLGALFGMDKAGNQGGNESLTYTAPKQPKKKEAAATAGKGAAPAVGLAVAVHAYKYVDNKYASQGKLGAAILTNHSTNEYSILMYLTQKQKITTAKITPSFAFTCQANNYANFYDDARQSWSVLFDNEQNAMDFAKQVCIAKALSTGATPTSLLSQDLTPGEGGALDSGDSVEVKYTGWLLTNNTIGQVFDTNTNADKLFRFKIGAGKVIMGWDTGVTGMKKGGKRFLVVPPSLAYGSQGMGNRVPPNSTLLFEVEVVRVKLVGRDSSPSPAQSIPTQSAAPAEIIDDMDDDTDHTVKGRTKSISEQLSHSPPGDTGKAKLISRMAKMGKPMLPFSGAVAAAAESDDEPVPVSLGRWPMLPFSGVVAAAAENDDEPVPESPQPVTAAPTHPEPVIHKPVPKAHPHHTASAHSDQHSTYQVLPPQATVQQTQPAFLQNLPGAQQMAVFQPQQNLLQQQQAAMMQGMQPPMYVAGQQQQSVAGTSLPYIVPGMPQGQDMVMMTEARQQNTEVRLSLSKVTDKVDTIIHKLDQAQAQTAGSSMLPNMETSVLLHNITRIVQENERLKKDVFEKSGKIESQNEKISELLQRNQSFVEKSQVLMEQRNEGLLSSANQSQSKLLSLEQDKVQLTKQLTDTTAQISSLQMEVTTCKKKEYELTEQLEGKVKDTRRHNEELDTLRSQHKEDESQISELHRQLREEKQARKSVEGKMSQSQEELLDLQDTKQALEKNLTERKRKAAEERRRLEDELEDVKMNLEADITSLKDKMRKQKSSASTSSQVQISQIEEEINRDWKEKSDKLLAMAAEKHNRALHDVQEEKEEVERKVVELESKIHALKTSSSGNVSQLQEELEEMAVWKDKYDSLRGNAAAMKERYEERISEIEEERDMLDSQKSALEAEVAALKAEGGARAPAGGGAHNLLDEVKRIMNNVYKEMREVFEADESYTGSEILAVVLNAIKSTTLSLMKRQSEQVNKEESEEEEEEESEEEEDKSEDEEEDEEEEEEEETVPDEPESATKVVVAETQKAESETVATEPVDVKNTEESSVNPDSESAGQSEVLAGQSEVLAGQLEVLAGQSEVLVNGDSGGDTVEEGTKPNGVSTEVEEDGDSEKTSQDKVDVEVESGVTTEAPVPTPTPSANTNLKKAGSLEDLLDSALDKSNRETSPLNVTEPPPLPGDSSEEEEEERVTEKDRTKSVFNDSGDDDDDHVADTLGLTGPPAVNGADTAKKQLINDEDLKPKPPPPLFGDDDEDDDLDWLS